MPFKGSIVKGRKGDHTAVATIRSADGKVTSILVRGSTEESAESHLVYVLQTIRRMSDEKHVPLFEAQRA